MSASSFSRPWVAGLVLLCSGCATVAQSASLAPPRISFIYPVPDGPVFDRACPGWLGQSQFTQDQRDAVIAKLPAFEEAWENVGARYVQMVLDETRQPFPYAEMQATLSLCVPIPMAMPLLIGVRELVTPTDPLYAHDFGLLAFHEVMHHYAMQIDKTSPLLAKYSTEPGDIRAHLHVVALERHVLEKTGRMDQLNRLHAYYVSLPRNSYARAWEIIDRETPQAFVNDLRDAPRPRQ